jgi:branched-chain amino acid transport system substrate-binding protein
MNAATSSKVALALVLALASTSAIAQVKIGVIASATGSTAVVGIPQKNTAALLPKKIGDLAIEYIVFDDASDSTQTVINVKKLLSESKIDALIGPSGSPNAVGVVQFLAETGTPMLAPVGTTAVVLPMDDKKRWVFKTTQNDALISSALIGHMVKNGVKTVGFIGFNDPYGENWYTVFNAQAQKAGIKIVASERYLRSDASVIGQVAKLMAAKPEAVLVAAAGGPTVLPQITLFDAGYKGRIYQTHGAAAPDFLRLGGAKVEGTVLAASLMLVLGEMPDGVPSKSVALEYIGAYEKMYGNKPATFGANVYDAGLLLVRAVPEAAKRGTPGTPEFRAALRDALEATRELVGTQGVYNMTAEDHSGFDERGRVLITVKDGTWRLLRD